MEDFRDKISEKKKSVGPFEPKCLGKENTSNSVIEIFKEQFSRNGVPEKLETVDAPQFTSYEFHHFPFDWEFTHLSSFPHHQIRRKGESAFKKALKDNKDP